MAIIDKYFRSPWASFAKKPLWCWLFSGFWLLATCSVAFFWHLGTTGLVDETEPLFAEAAKQMLLKGDWITPYFNGETRFDKPPLIYWLMALCYQFLGINEWSVRIPSALAAFALTVALFFVLKYFGYLPNFQYKPPQLKHRQLWLSAWIGSGIAALNLATILWARQGVSDSLLNGCMGTSLLCFFLGYARADRKGLPKNNSQFFPNNWYVASYILTTLAVLTKGPVGIILPGLIILIFLIYVGKLGEVWQELKVFCGAIIFLLITLPWYVLVTLANGSSYIQSFFGYHNLERFTSVVNSHSAPWYFYFLVVLAGFFPWSIYLPYSMAKMKWWDYLFWRAQPRHAHLAIFAFIWFVVIFIFFSVAVTKLPSYVLPLMPAAAIIVSLMWSEELTQKRRYRGNLGLSVSNAIAAVLIALVGIAIYLSPQLISNDPATVDLPQILVDNRINLLGAVIFLLAALAMGILLLQKKSNQPGIVFINLIGFLLFLGIALIPLMLTVDRGRQLPLREIARSIPQLKQPQESLIMVGFKKPSLVFYSNQTFSFFTVRSLIKYEEEYLRDLQEILAANPEIKTTLLIGRPEDLDRLGLQPQSYQIIAEEGRYQVRRADKELLVAGILSERLKYRLSH